MKLFLKKLIEFNPNIINSMDKLSKIAREEKTYIDRETAKVYEKILVKEINLNKIEYNEELLPTIILDLKFFNKEDIVIRKNLILYSINKLFGDTKGIEKVHIADFLLKEDW